MNFVIRISGLFIAAHLPGVKDRAGAAWPDSGEVCAVRSPGLGACSEVERDRHATLCGVT